MGQKRQTEAEREIIATEYPLVPSDYPREGKAFSLLLFLCLLPIMLHSILTWQFYSIPWIRHINIKYFFSFSLWLCNHVWNFPLEYLYSFSSLGKKSNIILFIYTIIYYGGTTYSKIYMLKIAHAHHLIILWEHSLSGSSVLEYLTRLKTRFWLGLWSHLKAQL